MTISPRWGGVSQGRLYENPEKTARYKAPCIVVPCSFAQNNAGTLQLDWHKSDTACSASVRAKENPGALGGTTGVKTSSKASQLLEDHTAFVAARHPILALHWGVVA